MQLMTDVLSEINAGKLNAMGGAKLSEIAAGCKATGKKGKLTLELELTPRGSDGKQVDISFKIKAVVPEKNLSPSIWFISGGNELTRDDPDQLELFARGEPKLKERV